MDKTELINKLTSVFRKIFNNESLVLSDGLTANDIDQWDSLSHMILITEIEKVFSIKFRLKELNKMRNVGDIVVY